ncbi:hypothetical protein MAM1_0665d11096 [Mucor ambiguus]|uniref:PH domain-containing protein n=1 Tax=Mucor ambiguus TaxID=91626 RepID=A0A0C9N635_9FUNG|nr:hypothetical protein MAM1_0665d11096 [Mucor ambiguus]
MTILWASTFSLCVLFVPKLFKILFPKKALFVSPLTEKRDGHDDEKTLYGEKQLLTMNRETSGTVRIQVFSLPSKMANDVHYILASSLVSINSVGNYVFKVHGAIGGGRCDLLIQVSNQKQLSRWLGLFDRKSAQHDRSKKSHHPPSLSVDKTHYEYSITCDSSNNSSKGSICDEYTSQFTLCSNETSASSVT